MPHLDREHLARLVEEPPDGAAAEHLRECDVCRAELEALREQTHALGALPPLDPPAEAWERLERRLTDEGLTHPARNGGGLPRALRMAAAIVALLAAGGLGAALQAHFGGRPGAPARPGAVASIGTPAAHAAAAADTGSSPTASDVARATDELHRAEAQYVAALANYDQLTQGNQPITDPSARLAALEGMVALTRAALDRAPADPVINGYHMTALAQRDATLRRLAAATAGPPIF